MRVSRSAVFSVVIVVTLLTAPVLEAQQHEAAAPIPAQIATAKKVFIANAGQDDLGGFGAPDRTYNQFYSAVKSSGQFQLVSTPADADLVFEISFGVQAVGANVIKGDSVGTPYAPSFRLVVLDPKTHFPLWTFHQHVRWAILTGNRDKNFDQGIAELVTSLKRLTAEPAPVQAAVQ